MNVIRQFVFASMIVLMSPPAFAQEVFSPYYVVIGGFRSEENAQKFCTYAHGENLPAVYAFNEERKMFYVYVRATQTRDIADGILDNLKANSVFKDSWIFNGVLSGSNLLAKNPKQVSEKPVLEPQPSVDVPKEEVVDDPVPVVQQPEDRTSSQVPEEPQVQVQAPKPVGKPFVFKLVNRETGDAVNGLVRLQESDRAAQFRGFNANETVYVPAPANKSGKWVVICHVLGFRQYKKPVAYDKAQEFEGASLGAGNEVIIPLELTRVKRGDYIEMEEVKFFNNAALFTPGSERELDELVAMMEENPDYQVRLHGHTNGTQPRDIVSIGSSTDFFNPHISNAKSHASAKELSLLRAELVKTYLVSKGVDESRISTKGEGGSQMIADSRGTLAGLNDRVEVEIRKH